MRRNCPLNFSKALPSLSKSLLEQNQQVILPHRDSHGRRIFIFRAEKWDPRESTPADLFSANYLCLEMLAKEAKTQVAGIVVVMDFKGFGLSHVWSVSVEDVKNLANLIQVIKTVGFC